MADNVEITPGSGVNVATDEVQVNGGTIGHVQYVKLVDGSSNGTVGLPGTSRGLQVLPRADLIETSVTSAGLTTATTAYVTGDQVGTIFTVANAATANGGYGYITGVALINAADNIGAIDVAFFDSNITLAGDNAPFAISDANALQLIGVVVIPAASVTDIGNNRIALAQGLRLPYKCDASSTSIYATLITRAGVAIFGATTDLQLNVFMERN
jgi:hypothetical protein